MTPDPKRPQKPPVERPQRGFEIPDPARGIMEGKPPGYPPAPIPPLEPIDQTIRQAAIQIGQAQSQVINPIQQTINAAEELYGLATDPLIGAIDRSMDEPEEALERLDNRIQRQIADSLNEAYAYANELGYQTPTLDEIASGVQGELALPGSDSLAGLPPQLPPELVPQEWASGNVEQPQTISDDGTQSGPAPILRLRPDLDGVDRLPYWEYQGLYFIDAGMPCGVPVPPGQGAMQSPHPDIPSPVYVFQTAADARAVCGRAVVAQPVQQPEPDEPPPPPPPESPCEQVPICPPCDIDFYYQHWNYGLSLSGDIPQGQHKKYVCAVRALAAFLCDVKHREPVTEADYHSIRQAIQENRPPLSHITNWRNKVLQTRGTLAWKASFAKELSCRYQLSDGTVIDAQDRCNGTPDECSALLDIGGQYGQGAAASAPTVPPCDPLTALKLPKWGSLEVCEDIDKATECLRQPGSRVSSSLGFTIDGEGDIYVPQWWKDIVGNLPGWVDEMVSKLAVRGMDGLEKLVETLPVTEYCNLPKMIVPIVTKVLMGILNKLIGGGLDDLMQGQTYAINYACPTLIPTTADAVRLWRQGVIDEKLAKCWIQANNDHFKPQQKLYEGQANRPLVMDAFRLHKLGKLKDDELDKLLTFNGVNVKDDKAHWERLFQQIPPYTDLIQMMVRDAEVERIVEEQGYDKGFQERWTGKVKEWAEAQGITEEVMRYIWRTHWRTVGLHQMAEAMFRLRPGKEGVKNETKESDVEKQLEIDDVPEFWRKRLVESLYRNLTRVDVRRAFEIGAIDKKEVQSAYQDEGYSEKNAKILADFAEKNAKRLNRRLGGVKPISWYTQQYVAGNITWQELQDRIELDIDDAEVTQQIMRGADQQKEIGRRQRAIKAVKKKYTLGDYDYGEAVAELIRCGVPNDLAKEALDYCQLQDQFKVKQVAASELCKWRSNGLISHQDHITRLQRIGYDQEESNLIANMCQVDINARMGKELERLQKSQLAEAKKALAAIEKTKCKPKKQCPEGQE